MPNKHKKSKSLKSPAFSKGLLLIFGLIFALAGGYAIYRSFAATNSTSTANIWVDPSGPSSCTPAATPVDYATAQSGNHVCNSWRSSANASQPGNIIAVRAGSYFQDNSDPYYQALIGMPGNPFDLSRGTGNPVTYECAGNGDVDTGNYPEQFFAAKYLTVQGSCFHFIHLFIGYSGDNSDAANDTFDGISMQTFRMAGVDSITVENSNVGPSVECYAPNYLAYGVDGLPTPSGQAAVCQNDGNPWGEEWWQSRGLGDGSCSTSTPTGCNASGGSEPGIQEPHSNVHLINNTIHGMQTRDNRNLHVGGVIFVGTFKTGDIISGNTFYGNAVYDVHFDGPSSGGLIENNFFGTPVNGLDVGSPNTTCPCNNIEFKAGGSGTISRYNTYSTGIGAGGNSMSGTYSIGDIQNTRFSVCSSGMTYLYDVWYTGDGGGTCGSKFDTFSSANIFTATGNSWSLVQPTGPIDFHLTTGSLGWEHGGSDSSNMSGGVPTGCGVSNSNCNPTIDIDGQARAAPYTPGADEFGGGGTPVPTVTIAANPTSITSGSSTTLTWSSTNATSCTASGAWSGSKATSGTQAVSPTTTSSYTLSCTGAGGSAQNSATVTVTSNPAPTATISANPTSITSGNSSTLTWSSTNATSCTASNAWSGTKATSGTQSVSPTTTSTYTLTCTGAGGTSSPSSATVTVTAGTMSITSFSPTSGPIGTVITINGTNLDQATDLRFNQSGQAAFTINSSTKITATVPTGAQTGQFSINFGEAVSPQSFTVTATVKLGDCNADGTVGLADLTALVANYKKVYPACDFNSDGIVNALDLSVLLSHYGN